MVSFTNRPYPNALRRLPVLDERGLRRFVADETVWAGRGQRSRARHWHRAQHYRTRTGRIAAGETLEADRVWRPGQISKAIQRPCLNSLS